MYIHRRNIQTTKHIRTAKHMRIPIHIHSYTEYRVIISMTTCDECASA